MATAVGACSASPAAPRRTSASPRGTAAVHITAATPPTRASEKPSPAPSPLGLVPSTTGRLAGTIQIDARYALDVGAAVLVGQGVSILANNGSTIVANNGGTIISEHGGGLVGNNGSTLVANNGGGLIGKVKFALTEVALPAPGTLMPVAGMGVTAVSMTSGKPLGKPVVTGADGVFHVDVPASEEGNVLVVAAPPDVAAAAAKTNPRLEYQNVTYMAHDQQLAASADTIDEDSAIVFRYFRGHCALVIREVIDATDTSEIVGQLSDGVGSQSAGFVTTILQSLKTRALADGYVQLSQDRQAAVAARVADFAVSDLHLDQVTVNDANTGWTGDPTEKALPVMISLLRRVREAGAQKLIATPDYFDHQSYVTSLAASLGKTIEIRWPSDLSDFCVNDLLASSDPAVVAKLDPVLNDLGIGKMVPDTDYYGRPGMSNLERLHYAAAVNGALLAFAGNIVAKSDAVGQMLDKEIAAQKAAGTDPTASGTP